MAITPDTFLVLDEQMGVQNDDTDNDVLLDATLLAHLVDDLGVQISATDPTTGFPQVAVNTALLDTTDVDNLALSIPADGTSSGLFTADGVEIFLYNEGGIIYGREADANGDADPAGDLAFGVALDVTLDANGDVSSAQVYLIQYEALQHNNPDAIDDGDILSFAEGKITLEVTTTEFVTIFQPLDFAAIPSGSPQELLTVATSDPTDNHSAQFDGLIFPAGTVDDPTVIDTVDGTDDDLNPDAIGFGVKGGQASQINQNEGFIVQDAAWDPDDPDLDANEIGGIKFDIQGIGNVGSVDIEWWAVDDGKVVASGTDHVTLPGGNAVFEDYTIDSTDGWPEDSVDQIYVRFTYDTKPDTSGVRVENLEVAFPSTTEVTVVTPEDLGTHLVFEDAGPTVTVEDIADGTYAAGGSSTWSEAPDADGFGSLSITLNSYTIDANPEVTVDTLLGTRTETDLSGNYVFTGSITDDFTDDGVANDQTVTFKLTFDPDDGTPADGGTYFFEATTPPGSTTTFSTADASLPAGGPDSVQTLTVDGIDLVFSAVVPTTASADITAFLNHTEADIEANATYLSSDEMNVSTAGIGNDNNNFDGNADSGIDGNTTQGGKVDESFVFDPDVDVSSVKVFIDNAVGGYDNPPEELYYLVYDADGNAVGTPTLVTESDLTAEGGGQFSFVIGDPEGSNDIDAVQFFMGAGTIKIPEIQFTVTTEFAPESLQLDFTATLVDGEGATADSSQDPFSVLLV
jgi:hypothetical protein